MNQLIFGIVNSGSLQRVDGQRILCTNPLPALKGDDSRSLGLS